MSDITDDGKCAVCGFCGEDRKLHIYQLHGELTRLREEIGRLRLLHTDKMEEAQTHYNRRLKELCAENEALREKTGRGEYYAADAFLIAAAPELLEACKRAKWLYDQLSLGPLEAAAKYGPDYIPPGEDELLEIREDIGAAIAKAEGRT